MNHPKAGSSAYSNSGEFLGVWLPKECEKHKFQPYEPHKGSFQILCVYCGLYKPNQVNLQPSVYAFKGRSFAFKGKDRLKTIRSYEV